MKTLYLIRGLPGAGKSTFASSLEVPYIEADMYFEDPFDGTYKFDASKLKNAHAWCQESAEELCKTGKSFAVSNTFTTEKELAPYVKLADKYGYTVFTLIIENRHGNPSVHDVPESTIAKMRSRFKVRL